MCCFEVAANWFSQPWDLSSNCRPSPCLLRSQQLQRRPGRRCRLLHDLLELCRAVWFSLSCNDGITTVVATTVAVGQGFSIACRCMGLHYLQGHFSPFCVLRESVQQGKRAKLVFKLALPSVRRKNMLKLTPTVANLPTQLNNIHNSTNSKNNSSKFSTRPVD